MHAVAIDGTRYTFPDLKSLLAKASPPRSGDRLAGVAATTAEERGAAQMALADLPLAHFLDEAIIPYEDDEVTRLILDTHDAAAFAPIAHLTVGGFRDWLLGEAATAAVLARSHPASPRRWPQRFQKSAATRTSSSSPRNAGWSRASATPSDSPGACRRASSRTIRPTIPRACWRRQSTASCSVAATPSSASIPQATHRCAAASSCICSTTCACGSRHRPSLACSPTSPRRSA